MRPSFMAPLYHEEKRGPGDFPGPRHYGSEVLEGVADPRCDRRHVLRIVLWTEHARRNAVDVGRAQSRRRLGQRGLVGIADPHVTAAQIEREPRREPPGDPGVQFSTQGAAHSGSSNLGTELDAGITWRFAPGLTFDLGGGYMWVGDAYKAALSQASPALSPANVNGVSTSVFRPENDPKDVTTVAARVRYSF